MFIFRMKPEYAMYFWRALINPFLYVDYTGHHATIAEQR